MSKQAQYLQQLDGNAGEGDAQHGRSDDADEDRLVALVLGKPAAARPMTMALSPASTRSIIIDLGKGRQRLADDIRDSNIKNSRMAGFQHFPATGGKRLSPSIRPLDQVMRLMLAAISSGSKTFFQSVLHQGRLAELDRLVAGVREYTIHFLENDRAQHVHMAEQEIPRCLCGNAPAHHFIHGFAHDIEQRGTDRLRQSGFQQCHLLNGDPVRAHNRCPDGAGDLLAQRIGRIRPLHQCTDDMLFRGDAAKMILLGNRIRLIVEDRGVTGVCHEIGEVIAFRQMAGKRCRRIKHDDHGAWFQQRSDGRRNLSDHRVGHGKNGNLSSFERGFRSDTFNAKIFRRGVTARIHSPRHDEW